MKKIIVLISLFFVQIALAGHSSLIKVPELIQLEVVGDELAPFFNPDKLELKVDQPYVLVIVNNKPYSVAFEYTGLGRAVRSQSLKGSNSVTTESIILPPNSKVQWQFTTMESGDFEIGASNIAFRHKGKLGKVEISPT